MIHEVWVLMRVVRRKQKESVQNDKRSQINYLRRTVKNAGVNDHSALAKQHTHRHRVALTGSLGRLIFARYAPNHTMR